MLDRVVRVDILSDSTSNAWANAICSLGINQVALPMSLATGIKQCSSFVHGLYSIGHDLLSLNGSTIQRFVIVRCPQQKFLNSSSLSMKPAGQSG